MDRFYQYWMEEFNWSPPEPHKERPLLEPLVFAPGRYCIQEQSPLFSLPGEIRDQIFAFALAPFEDEESKYESQTYHARPDYFAPQRSSTQLLRTCQRAYCEAWFRPWISAQQTVWLTSPDRAPPRSLLSDQLRNIVEQIQSRHGDIILERFRIFAQLWALQDAQYLQDYLDIPHFHPRQITITIRHTDWWWWEHDTQLGIGCDWTRKNVFPSSLEVLKIDLESLERKKEQIDSVAEQMKAKLFFSRKDGVHLFASGQQPDQVTRWQGSSSLGKLRWLRDEQVPGKLNYYIRTATWRADPNRSTKNWKSFPETVTYIGSQAVLAQHPRDSLPLADLRNAGIEDDVPADETRRRFEEWTMAQRAARSRARSWRRNRDVQRA